MKNNMGVYGTLKKGYRLHGYLGEDTKLIKETEVEGYELFDTGIGYPLIVPSKKKSVFMEIYEVDEDRFTNTTAMEQSAGYKTKEITVEGVKCAIFYFKRIEEALRLYPALKPTNRVSW